MPAITETLPSPFVATFNGLMARKIRRKDIVDMIAAEIVAAEKTPAFLEKLSMIGVEPAGTTPQEMAAEIAAEIPNDGAPSHAMSRRRGNKIRRRVPADADQFAEVARCSVCARGLQMAFELGSRPQKFFGIDRLAADARLVVQMRSGRAAGRADAADDLAGLHGLSDFHIDGGQVTVAS